MTSRSRRLRHWKQQFDPDSKFIWRRATLFNGVPYEAGDVLPEDVIQKMGVNKLRRLWQSSRIELHGFDAPPTAHPRPAGAALEQPSGEADPMAAPPGTMPSEGDTERDISIKHVGGPWFIVTIDGVDHKVRGRAKAAELVGSKERVDLLLSAMREMR
jgi:hypothetical protein